VASTQGSLHMTEDPKAHKEGAGLMFQHKACSTACMRSRACEDIIQAVE